MDFTVSKRLIGTQAQLDGRAQERLDWRIEVFRRRALPITSKSKKDRERFRQRPFLSVRGVFWAELRCPHCDDCGQSSVVFRTVSDRAGVFDHAAHEALYERRISHACSWQRSPWRVDILLKNSKLFGQGFWRRPRPDQHGRELLPLSSRRLFTVQDARKGHDELLLSLAVLFPFCHHYQ